LYKLPPEVLDRLRNSSSAETEKVFLSEMAKIDPGWVRNYRGSITQDLNASLQALRALSPDVIARLEAATPETRTRARNEFEAALGKNLQDFRMKENELAKFVFEIETENASVIPDSWLVPGASKSFDTHDDPNAFRWNNAWWKPDGK
jgi:hypothetical protein